MTRKHGARAITTSFDSAFSFLPNLKPPKKPFFLFPTSTSSSLRTLSPFPPSLLLCSLKPELSLPPDFNLAKLSSLPPPAAVPSPPPLPEAMPSPPFSSGIAFVYCSLHTSNPPITAGALSLFPLTTLRICQPVNHFHRICQPVNSQEWQDFPFGRTNF